MSQISVPEHTKRLAGMVHRPGGITEAEAVKAANANLASIRNRTLQELNTMLLAMHDLGAGLRSPPNEAGLQLLYRMSNEVIGVAGVFGMSGISAVAYSLCELIDRLRMSRTWHAQALRVHLDSMRLMQDRNFERKQEMEVREALRQMVDRVPASAA